MVVGAMVVNLTVLNIITFNKAKQLDSLAECDKFCVMNLIEEKLVSSDSTETKAVLQEAKATIESPSCDAVCAEKIVRAVVPEVLNKMKLSLTVSTTPTPTPTQAQPSSTVKPTAVAAEKNYVIQLPNASAMGSAWSRMASTATNLDVYLYGATLVGATWEGWLEVVGGSGKGYARLYDMTNHRVVDGSEVIVSGNSKASFYSGNLSLWRGQNQYMVEVRTDSGSEIKLSDAKIKLVMR